MNISDMPASREVDLRIAREVFGLTEPERRYNWRQNKDGTWSTYGVWIYSTWPPLYSTDIAAAWEIVDIFRRGWNGHGAATTQIVVSDAFTHPACCISISVPDFPDLHTWADTVPLAICRAALMVVERCEEGE